MAAIRKINWTAAMRDMRNDRAKPVAGYLAARSLEIARLDRLAKEAAAVPFAVAGSYDRSAIMKAAVASARAEKAKGSKLLGPSSWASLSRTSGATPRPSAPSLLTEEAP
jgi:hypothetical protein